MHEIGYSLKQAREEMQMTIEDLSCRTMIAKKYLLALENGEYEKFSGEVYLKGALRKYALEVGMDPKQVISWYEDNKNNDQPTPEKEISESETNKQSEISEISEKGIAATYINGRKVKIKTGRLVSIIGCIILCLLVLSGIYNLLNSSDTDTANNDNITNHPEAEDVLPIDEEESEDLPPETINEVKVERDPDTNDVRFLVYEAENLLVELSFTERCWLRAIADGKQEVEKNFTAGMSHLFEANNNVNLNVGYSNGINIKINNIDVDIPRTSGSYRVEIQLVES